MNVVMLACKKPNFKQNLPGKVRYNLLCTEPVDNILCLPGHKMHVFLATALFLMV